MSTQCIFCRIVAGEIPSTRVLETDRVVAIRDVNPQAPTHVLVMPRTHVPGFGELPAASATWTALLAAVQEVVQSEGLSEGYRLVINNGVLGGQTVPHLHIHVLGGGRCTGHLGRRSALGGYAGWRLPYEAAAIGAGTAP